MPHTVPGGGWSQLELTDALDLANAFVSPGVNSRGELVPSHGASRRHRVDKTYRDVTDRCKHCGRLRYHVPTFFQAIGRKMINCACSASLKRVVIRLSSNQMHASSNLPSMRTKKVGTLVTSLYVSTLWRRRLGDHCRWKLSSGNVYTSLDLGPCQIL